MVDELDVMGRVDMVGLTYGEHLIVWGLRRIVTGQGADALFSDEALYAFGQDGMHAVATFCTFLCLLGRSARKPFEIGRPGALTLTRDERRILLLLSAAQIRDETGCGSRMDAHLSWLAVPVRRQALAEATTALARLLATHGHQLPVEEPALPARSAPADPVPGGVLSFSEARRHAGARR